MAIGLGPNRYGATHELKDLNVNVALAGVLARVTHHFLVDLSRFGVTNDGAVFHADDRPYGVIEGVVQRDEVPQAPQAWKTAWIS